MIRPDVLWGGVVAAGIPGITTQQSFNAEPPPLQYTVFRQSIAGIVWAGRGKSAGWRTERAKQILVGMYQLDHKSAHLFSTLLNSIFKLPICALASNESARLNITTISRWLSLMLCWRNASLIILFARFRSTAPESVFLLAIIPSLALFIPLRTKKTLKCWSDTFAARTALSNPFFFSNRYAAENLADKAERLYCESCTALGTARINNSTATACFHAYQKSMGAFSSGYWWLVCALHVIFLGNLLNLLLQSLKARLSSISYIFPCG